MERKRSVRPSATGRVIEAAATRAALEAGARAELAGVDPGGIKAEPAKKRIGVVHRETAPVAKRARAKVSG